MKVRSMPRPNPNTTKATPVGRVPTARELVAAKGARGTQTTAVAVKELTPLVAKAPDTRPHRDRYLDDVSPATLVGRRIKFSKDGDFITVDDDQVIPEGAEFVALCDQALVGWLKFNGAGEPPISHMGLLYGDDFEMPERESLGDLDISQWEEGLDGKPADPWQHHMYLVLQDAATAELFTFTTASKTGRNAVGTLLRHFNRMQHSHPDEYPVVRLGTGGFNHRDERVGWVTTPVFVVCGRSPRHSVAKPDTSIGTFLNDEIAL